MEQGPGLSQERWVEVDRGQILVVAMNSKTESKPKAKINCIHELYFNLKS